MLPAIKEFSSGVEAFWGADGLTTLLSSDKVEAVIVVTAVQSILQDAKLALSYGKHVLQEKPAGQTVSAVLEAIAEHRAQPKAIWNLAENFRFENVFWIAKEKCESLGKIIKLDLVADMAMNEKNKYFSSGWRRDTEGNPFGFLMESAVHYIAGLRVVAEGCGCGDPVLASGVAMNVQPHRFPGLDTIVGWVKFDGGIPATVSVSFATQQMKWSLRIAGEKGTIEIHRGSWGGSRGGYMLSSTDTSSEGYTEEKVKFTGVEWEFLQFIKQVNAYKRGETELDTNDVGSFRARIEEGAKDMALFEALAKSSEKGGIPVEITQIR